MEISELTLRLIFLSIPGIICYLFLFKLTPTANKNNFEIFLLIFLYSVLSYLVYSLFLYLFKIIFCIDIDSDIITLILTDNSKIEFYHILFASFVAISIALIMSFLTKINFLNKIGQKLKLTAKYGNEDVWHFFHNLSLDFKNDGYVVIRDHKYKLTYFGFISHWSESEKERELLIENVSIFDIDSNKLYDAERIYISRNRDDLTIEVIRPTENSENGR